MKKTLWIIILIIIIVLAGIVFSQRDSQKPSGEESIKIGGLFGLSGFVSFAGEASRDGFLMAIEDSELEIDYVIEDFQSDLKTVVTASKKLIDVDGVSVIIGPEWNEFGEIVAPLADEERILFISPWMTGEQEWVNSKYYFSATPSERIEISELIDHMKENSVENIALVYSNNAWAFGTIDIFKDEIRKGGSGISIIDEFKENQDTTDYRTTISKIKALNPDALYVVIATDIGQETFSKQLREQQAEYQLYIPFSRGDFIVSSESNYGIDIIYPATKEYKNSQLFNEKYEARFGRSPAAISAATTYDMTTLVLMAIKEGARTTEDVRKYLLKIKDYDGFSNLINFNERGQAASKEVELRQITKEGFDILN